MAPIKYIVEAAGCLDFASSIEEAIAQIRAMVWEEVEVRVRVAYQPSSRYDEEYIRVYSLGVSLPPRENRFMDMAARRAAYQAAAAAHKGQAVGRISRKIGGLV